MEQVLPLHFEWCPPHDGLWIRATVLFKEEHHRSEPVIRCPNHMDAKNNSNTEQRVIRHVIRCRHNTSIYEQASNGHLSVLTPLGRPEPGLSTVPMDFIFYCKNSCATGMNRRATELILTLEDDKSAVLGRQKLEVRVCSCPKRDKDKEERELDLDPDQLMSVNGKKRKAKSSVPPPGKRMASTSNETKHYTLQINVLGRESAQAIIKYAYDVQAGAARRSNHSDLYQPYLDELANKKVP